MTTPNAPHTRAEQFAFLRNAHEGPNTWRQLCLSLARQAAGLPAVYPSALAAQEATPKGRRFPLAKAKRGMVAYFDDPDDSNPYGHIVTVAGWDGDGRDLEDLLVWSNDAKRSGGVDLVRGSFFPAQWGDRFQFATDWLNGYDLPGFDADKTHGMRPVGPTLGSVYDEAIANVRRSLRFHRSKGHKRIVEALSEDLARMKATRRRFQ